MSKFTTIGRKVLMAFSGFFLMFFLLQHLTINMLSVVSPEMFNSVSHFMGYNPLVQFALQPVLIFAVVFHFVMGFYLELKNNNARMVKYAANNPGKNSTWMSRNMVYSGLVVLAFLVVHFYDFWIHEMNYKYVSAMAEDATRYHHELVEKFQDPIKVVLYVLSFVFLALHLLHGFQSSFQTVGFNNKYTPLLKKLGIAFGIGVPALFALIAIYHFVNPTVFLELANPPIH